MSFDASWKYCGRCMTTGSLAKRLRYSWSVRKKHWLSTNRRPLQMTPCKTITAYLAHIGEPSEFTIKLFLGMMEQGQVTIDELEASGLSAKYLDRLRGEDKCNTPI